MNQPQSEGKIEVTSDYFMMFSAPPLFAAEFPGDTDAVQKAMSKMPFRKSLNNDTSVSQYVLDEPEFAELKGFTDFCIQKYMHDVLHVTNHEMVVTQSWGNCTPHAHSHPKHYHMNSTLSGVYYVKSEDDAPPIVFDTVRTDPFPIRPESDPALGTNEFMNDSYSFPASTGHLLIFPSILQHYVPRNEGKEDRISISFNTFPKLPVGSHDNSTLLTIDKL